MNGRYIAFLNRTLSPDERISSEQRRQAPAPTAGASRPPETVYGQGPSPAHDTNTGGGGKQRRQAQKAAAGQQARGRRIAEQQELRRLQIKALRESLPPVTAPLLPTRPIAGTPLVEHGTRSAPKEEVWWPQPVELGRGPTEEELRQERLLLMRRCSQPEESSKSSGCWREETGEPLSPGEQALDRQVTGASDAAAESGCSLSSLS